MLCGHKTLLMMLALQAMGYQHRFLVPNRFHYGYGLTQKLLDWPILKPDLVYGNIDPYRGASLAKQLGIKVIVTDHHLPDRSYGCCCII